MSLLVTSIAPDNLDDLRARAERAWAGGTDAVEIRIDAYDDDPAALATYLRAQSHRTWIVTCRSAAEGGNFRGDTAERVSRLIAAARGTDALVDFELADWRRSDNIRQKIQLASARSDGDGHRLILSAHDLSEAPSDPAAIVYEAIEVPAASAVKVAYPARTICDAFSALDLMHEHKGAVTAVAMGEDGLWSRVLARKLGAFSTYCALDAASATAPGQVTLDEMIDRYHWPRLGPSTRVFGVLGDPVAHSMGPVLFNRWFSDFDIDAVYIPLLVRESGDGLERFLDGCLQRPWLDLGGFSVTLPHKSAALRWVGDGADSFAAGVGALNTLVFGKGKVQGFNTDCRAALESMIEALGCDEKDLRGMPVDVLGTGGVARAVVAGLCDAGCAVSVYGRSLRKIAAITSDFACRPAVWEQRIKRFGRVLINCTDIGMWPATGESPMPPESLSNCELVFDVIYNPLETRLLKDAADADVKTRSGLDMFIRQAAMQFELWTSTRPNLRQAREVVAREILRQIEPRP